MLRTHFGFILLLLAFFATRSVQPSAVGPIPPPEDDGYRPGFPHADDKFTWEEDDSPSARFRLPSNVMPRHYSLQIRPIISEGLENRLTAPGIVQITVECINATSDIVLHAIELDINRTSVKIFPSDSPTQLLTVTGFSENADFFHETFTIHLGETLEVGVSYDVYIEYVAAVRDEVVANGVYLSYYNDDEGVTHYLASTQFSRTRAFRKTLPSFDEPNQKATFQITVGREERYHSRSNMNLSRTETRDLPGWYWDVYETTPVMPPTIIAFIVSEFDSETADPELYNPDKPVKIWGPPPEIKDGGALFSAEAAARTLRFLEDHFGVEYELPKIDSAAIPHFAAGAMENWGLNTYRIEYLIWKEGRNTIAQKFNSARIIGHELAHQFWGNLVTHAWWNDWWLTEGFASYYEWKTMDLHPEFDGIYRFLSNRVHSALIYDAGPDTHPIHGTNDTHFVENNSNINYGKGAALVNLMRSFMTDVVFRGACNHYLTKRAYTAVHQDSLFNDFTEYLSENNAMPSNNKTIKEIMDTWTTQTRFPLLRISRASTSRIYISQERFANRDVPNKGEGLWHVPVFYISSDSPEYDIDNDPPKFWMDKESILQTHPVDTTKWILVNPGGQAYYRVIYDQYLGSLLELQLQEDIESIPVGGRSTIVDDYFTAAYEGYLPIEDAMKMTTFISQETHHAVWIPYIKHLTTAYNVFSDNATMFDAFRTHILERMEAPFDVFGYEQIPNERYSFSIFREELYRWACPMLQQGCVDEANSLLATWIANPSVNPIPLDIQASIMCAAAAANTDNWEFIMGMYDTTNEVLFRNALPCTTNPTQIQQIVDKVLNEAIRQADVVGFMTRLAANSEARPLVIQLLEDEFDTLITAEKLRPAGIASVITEVAIRTSSLTILEQLEEFVDRHRTELIPVMNTINNAFATIRANNEWMLRFGNAIFNVIS